MVAMLPSILVTFPLLFRKLSSLRVDSFVQVPVDC